MPTYSLCLLEFLILFFLILVLVGNIKMILVFMDVYLNQHTHAGYNILKFNTQKYAILI